MTCVQVANNNTTKRLTGNRNAGSGSVKQEKETKEMADKVQEPVVEVKNLVLFLLTCILMVYRS